MERMTSIDRSMLGLETSSQLLQVLATIVIQPDPGVRADELFLIFRKRVHERLPLVPRFWQKPAPSGVGGNVWVDDPDFEFDSHLFRHRAHAPGDIDALAAVAGAVAGRQLPRDRPMWEMHFIDGLEGGRVAIVAKVHHSVLDGVSGFATLATFFDLEPHAPPQRHVQPEMTRTSQFELARERVEGTLEWARSIPSAIPKTFDLVTKMVGRRDDPDTALPLQAPRAPFNGTLTPRRIIEFTEVDLVDLKDARKVLDATLNDVIVATCAGALRSWLDSRDELPDQPLVAAVPVSERQLGDPPAGNRFSTMFYGLPTHLADPLERLRAVTRSSTAAKELHSETGDGTLEALAKLAPAGVMRRPMEMVSRLGLVDRFTPPVNLIISNVRGPEFPLYIDGGQISHVFPMGPLFEGCGVNITVASYLDRVGFGFLGCPDLVTDLEGLAMAVPGALQELVKAADG
jgi:diacylglycerol O-acyltransferase